MDINPQQEITIRCTNVQPGSTPTICIDGRNMDVAFDIENFFNGKSHLKITGTAIYTEFIVKGMFIYLKVASESPANGSIDIQASIAKRADNKTFVMYTQETDCSVQATVAGVTKTLGNSGDPTEFDWSNS